MTNFRIGYGREALDDNQIFQILEGDYVISGCTPSDGTNAMEVDIASGTVSVGGSITSVSSQTVTLDASNADPRKDVIYIDGTGTATKITGTAAAAEPSGDTQFDTYHPAPPDMNATTGVVVAEVWVGGGTSDVSSADIRDRTGSVVTSDIGGGIVQPDQGGGTLPAVYVDSNGVWQARNDDNTEKPVNRQPFVYDPGMSIWEDGLSNVEINRINLSGGETLVVERIEYLKQGGGSNSNTSIDVRDATSGTTIGSQTLGGVTTNPGSSGTGNTVLIRLTNSTSGEIKSAPRVIGYIEGS